MTHPTPAVDDLPRRIRATLFAVADTVTDTPAPPPAPAPAPAAAGRRRSRRTAVIAASAAATVCLAAFAVTRPDETVLELPPPGAFVEGTADGTADWLIPSFQRDRCDRPETGVTLVSAATNKVGQPWNTGGTAYGEQQSGGQPGCPDFDQQPWLADPALSSFGWTRLGPSGDDGPWAALVAAHPTATTVEARLPDGTVRSFATEPRPDDPEGPRYGVVALPEDTGQVTVVLLAADGTRISEHPADLDALERSTAPREGD